MEEDIQMISTKKKLISDAEFERQMREAEKVPASEPEAVKAFYKDGEIHIFLASGWTLSFPPKRFSEFRNATEKDLKAVGLIGRYTLTCDPLDVDMSVGGIIFELIGDKFLNAEIARRNGSATTEKKKVASRTNGKLGGRPKKVRKDLVA